jgi:hypothetical protein
LEYRKEFLGECVLLGECGGVPVERGNVKTASPMVTSINSSESVRMWAANSVKNGFKELAIKIHSIFLEF